MAILGLIVFIMAVTIRNSFDQWSALVSMSSVWVGLFSGLLLMALSLLGCYAAKKNKKTYLCMYLVGLAVVLAIQIGAAVVFIAYSNSFKFGLTNPSSTLTARADVDLNNAVLSAYIKCCSGCPSGCNNPTTNSYYPGVHPYCYQRPAPPGSATQYIVCDTPAACPSAGQASYCFKYLPGDALMRPTTYVDQTVCTMLSGLSTGAGPLVGYVDKGGCGGGSSAQFFVNMDSYFSPKVYLVGVAFAIIALIQSSIFFLGIYIIMCSSKNVDDDDYVERRNRP